MTTAFSQFNTQPQAVNEWLENLPIASIGETARQLYMVMRDVNRQDNVPVKQHFHLLEGITEPLTLILPELYRHYAGKPLPLSEKRRKVADLYTQLLRQSILGYQQVIAHSIELSRFGWKKVVTTSVHRIFYLSSLLLCNYRQLYMPYQKGMWQQLYWIYQLIEKYNLLSAKITGLGEASRKTSIDIEFKKLLLHSLLSPNLFKPAELQNVIQNLDIWVQRVAVGTTHRGENTQTYAFTLETDMPPALIAQDLSGSENQLADVRYLDITDLIKQINKLLNNAKPGKEEIKLSRGRFASRRSMLILINSWGRPGSRDGERRLIQGNAEIAIGVSAIHYVISDGRQPGPADIPGEEAEEAIELQDKFSITIPPAQPDALGQLGFTAEQNTGLDVWDSAYFEQDAPAPSWTESMRMKVYSYLNAKVLNISKGGFCIALPQDGVDHIQMNEVIAVRGKTGQWQLGEIRWMVCPTTGPIRAGIKQHSQMVRPAELTLQADFKSLPIKCLLGKSENGYMLFLPNIPTQLDGKEITLDCNGDKRTINFIEQVYSSPVGSAHLIEYKDAKPVPSSLAKNNDDYESIWASL